MSVECLKAAFCPYLRLCIRTLLAQYSTGAGRLDATHTYAPAHDVFCQEVVFRRCHGVHTIQLQACGHGRTCNAAKDNNCTHVHEATDAPQDAAISVPQDAGLTL